MKKKKLFAFLFVCLSLLFASQWFNIAHANEKEFVLSHIMPLDHFFHDVSEVFIKQISALSNDSMKVLYHPGGDLGDWTTQFDQAIQGIIPMTMVWNFSELDPRLDLSILGFVADNWETARAIFGPEGVLIDVYRDILIDLNLLMIGTIPNGFAGFTVRRGLTVPMNFPEDARGFKMRIPQFVMGVERYKALGFSPVIMAFSELHTALQTGAVDGRAYGPAGDITPFSDVLGTFVYTKEHLDHVFFVVSKLWFEKLSEQEQKWIWEAGKMAVEWAWINIETEEEEKLQECRDRNMDVITLSQEQQEKYKQIVRDAEWPLFEEIAGKEMMDKIKKIVAEAEETK